MKTKSFFKQATLAVLLVVLLSAFGCRTNEEESANENVNAEPETTVTFNIPESGEPAPTVEDVNDGVQVSNPSEGQSEMVTTDESTVVEEEPSQPAQNDQQEVVDLAEKIVEIFGSFTNKSREPFKNVTDIEVYATDNLLPFLSSLKQNEIDPNAPFYGITTKALSTAVLSSSTNSLELLITTEREEITDATQRGSKRYVLIQVDMVKQDDGWKVNGLFWQE